MNMSTEDPARSDDPEVASPEAVVWALYDVISGPADQERDWDRLRGLFQEDARIMVFASSPDGTDESAGWSVEEFVAQAREEYREEGFWEREIWNRTERFGNVAHVFSTYESHTGVEDSEPAGRGINSVQTVRRGGRWWIANLVFDIEQPHNPIPEAYLPPAEARRDSGALED